MFLPAQVDQKAVDEAVVIVKQVEGEEAHDNKGNKVGQQNDRLGKPLEELVADLRDHDGKYNLDDVAQTQEHHIVKQGVAGNPPEVTILNQELKVFQTNEGTGEDALFNVEINKGHISARHGNVVKDDEIKNSRQQHQVQHPFA